MIDWDNQPLGQIPDTQLAKLLSCAPSQVTLARHRRGIPSFTELTGIDYPTKAAGVNWDKQPLGGKPDCELAWELGVSEPRVAAARRARDIQTYQSRTGIHRSRSVRHKWEEIPLGQMSDHNVSRVFRIPVSTVSHARRRRGIPSFSGES